MSAVLMFLLVGALLYCLPGLAWWVAHRMAMSRRSVQRPALLSVVDTGQRTAEKPAASVRHPVASASASSNQAA